MPKLILPKCFYYNVFLVKHKTFILSLCGKFQCFIEPFLWSTGLWQRSNFLPAFLNLSHIINVKIEEKNANQYLICGVSLRKRRHHNTTFRRNTVIVIIYFSVVNNKSNIQLIYIFWGRRPNVMITLNQTRWDGKWFSWHDTCHVSLMTWVWHPKPTYKSLTWWHIPVSPVFLQWDGKEEQKKHPEVHGPVTLEYAKQKKLWERWWKTRDDAQSSPLTFTPTLWHSFAQGGLGSVASVGNENNLPSSIWPH